jgi:hypothetical protein
MAGRHTHPPGAARVPLRLRRDTARSAAKTQGQAQHGGRGKAKGEPGRRGVQRPGCSVDNTLPGVMREIVFSHAIYFSIL